MKYKLTESQADRLFAITIAQSKIFDEIRKLVAMAETLGREARNLTEEDAQLDFEFLELTEAEKEMLEKQDKKDLEADAIVSDIGT